MIDQRQIVLTFGATMAVLLVTLPVAVVLASGRGVGLHRGIPRSVFDLAQLQVGIQIELEHTSDSRLAVEIAKDHLVEDSRYYSKLCQFVEPNEPKCQPLLAKAA